MVLRAVMKDFNDWRHTVGIEIKPGDEPDSDVHQYLCTKLGASAEETTHSVQANIHWFVCTFYLAVSPNATFACEKSGMRPKTDAGIHHELIINEMRSCYQASQQPFGVLHKQFRLQLIKMNR